MNCDTAPKQEVDDLTESKPEEIESSPQFVKRRTELPKPQHYKNTIHLWEYLLELLSDDSCRSFITWSRQDYGEFKLKDQEEVAKRWGLLKRKKGMNYEKLSRALRYYYRQEIIKKVPGQRLVYKFNKLPYKYVPGVTRSHHQLQRIHDSIHTQERRRVSPPKQLSASPPCRLEVHESSAFSRTPTPLGKCWSWPVVPMPPRTLSWYPGNIAGMPPMCFAGSEIFKFPVVEQMSPISGSFVVRPVSPVSPVYKMCAAPRSIPVSVIKQAA